MYCSVQYDLIFGNFKIYCRQLVANSGKMLNQKQNQICLEIEMCSENESFWIESEIGRT